MTGWPDQPVIYEINTAIWLGEKSRAAGRRVTLADVPASAWDDVTPAGTNAVGGWPDNDSCRNLLAWSWAGDDAGRHVVVVNLSGVAADGRVRLGWTDLRGHGWKLTDLLDDREFDRSGDELADQGLYVALEPWGYHLLAMLPQQLAGSAGISGRS